MSLEPGQMYIGLCGIRNGEAQLRWSRAQFFLTVNTGLLALLPVVINYAPTNWKIPVLLFIGFGGMSLSAIWIAATNRADIWINYWNQRIATLEQALTSENAKFGTFSSNEFKLENQNFPSFHHILTFLSWSLAALWALILIVIIALAVSQQVSGGAFANVPAQTTPIKPTQ